MKLQIIGKNNVEVSETIEAYVEKKIDNAHVDSN
jgi:ribosome-associated translation inhibitor RaiA